MQKMNSQARWVLVLLFTLPALLWATGCGDDGTGQSSDSITQQGPAPVVIDETGNGQIFDVVEGQQVIVRLPGNPTTGYEWAVAATDRTFGYPVNEAYSPDGDRIGGGGVYEFVWETSGALSMLGVHTVVLEYARSWEEEAIDTFTFSVNIVSPGEQPPEPLIIDETGNEQSFDVVEGTDVVVRLAGNPTTGYEWSVASTDRSFGYPVNETYLPDGGGTGSGGVYEFIWQTSGALSLVGSHTVVLQYARSWEDEPAETFTFTVNVLAADD